MKHPAQESRNRKRHRLYKDMAGGETRAQKRARLKLRRVVRKVGSRGPHVEPCGNLACQRCYGRIVGVGTTRR